MNRDPLALNPLLQDWRGAYGLAPFGSVQAAHFLPAFEVAQASHLAELDAIACNPAPASFANILQAFDSTAQATRASPLPTAPFADAIRRSSRCSGSAG